MKSKAKGKIIAGDQRWRPITGFVSIRPTATAIVSCPVGNAPDVDPGSESRNVATDAPASLPATATRVPATLPPATTPIPGPPSATDWETLIATLDRDELAFMTLHIVQGFAQRDVAHRLGWCDAKGERVRRRVDRRIKRLRQAEPELPVRNQLVTGGGSSRRPVYRERLDCGRWIYSLTHSQRLGCPQLPISEGRVTGIPPRYIGPPLTTGFLTTPITDPKENTDMTNQPAAITGAAVSANPAPTAATTPTNRAATSADPQARIVMVGMLCDNLFDAEFSKADLLRELERQHAIAELACESDRRFALVNRKVANRELRKELDALATQVTAARNDWQQSTDDLAKQRAVLAGLVAEQATAIKLKALKTLGSKGQEFAELVDKAAELAQEIDRDTRDTGITYSELFGDLGDFLLRWRKQQLAELIRYKYEVNSPWINNKKAA
jgi:hypothetical protein